MRLKISSVKWWPFCPGRDELKLLDHADTYAGVILGMGSANERKRYDVMPSLIGRARTQDEPWYVYYIIVK